MTDEQKKWVADGMRLHARRLAEIAEEFEKYPEATNPAPSLSELIASSSHHLEVLRTLGRYLGRGFP